MRTHSKPEAKDKNPACTCPQGQFNSELVLFLNKFQGVLTLK